LGPAKTSYQADFNRQAAFNFAICPLVSGLSAAFRMARLTNATNTPKNKPAKAETSTIMARLGLDLRSGGKATSTC
jgi:hypothetical protein